MPTTDDAFTVIVGHIIVILIGDTTMLASGDDITISVIKFVC